MKTVASAIATMPLSKKIIDQIFARFAANNPKPTTELIYKSPFELLIAVILSAQATDKSVNKATHELFAIADTPRKMLALGEKRLNQYIKTIGLHKNKTKFILACCEKLIKNFNSQVPQTRAELESLDGVGRKTANVILNTYFGQPTIAVDTHIFRVANRTELAVGKTPLAVELKLEKTIPQKYLQHAHHWLILHGRYTCIARKPKCANCIIQDLCPYPNKTM